MKPKPNKFGYVEVPSPVLPERDLLYNSMTVMIELQTPTVILCQRTTSPETWYRSSHHCRSVRSSKRLVSTWL